MTLEATKLERISYERAGWNCLQGLCEYDHDGGPPDGRHGCHGMEWIYVLVAPDRRTAFSLTVTSEVLIAGRPLGERVLEALLEHTTVRLHCREGTDLTLHANFPTELEHAGRDCRFVEGGQCFGAHSSGLAARDFWRDHGDPVQRVQSEAFWEALRVKFVDWDAHVRRDGEDLARRRCPTCGGRGEIEPRK